MTMVIDWHDATTELPTESCRVIVYTETGYFTDVPYSSKHKAFNTRDEYKNADHAINVRYWAEYPEFPEDESEDVNNG